MSAETNRLIFLFMGSLVALLLLFSLLIGFKNRANFSTALKFFLAYLSVSFACELTATIFYATSKFNLWLINLYTLLEFFFIAMFIVILCVNSVQRKRVLQAGIGILVLGSLIYLIASNRFWSYSSITETIENVMLMGFCIYYFVYALNGTPNCKPEEIKLVNRIVVSLFIYLSGIVLIWLFYEFLDDEIFDRLARVLSYVNSFLNLGLKVAILVALLSYDHQMRRIKTLGIPHT